MRQTEKGTMSRMQFDLNTRVSERVFFLHFNCRRKQWFHSHSQPFAAALTQINGWEGGMHKSSGHIDHATVVQFQQGDFVDQTQHVKNAFCFCMMTLMACVSKTWQRSDIRNSNMLCQKTSASDEAIVYTNKQMH